jgi:soluble lytic murein transglycosylase-like protein
LSAPHSAKVAASYRSAPPSSSSAAIGDTLSDGLLSSRSVRIDKFFAPVDVRHAYDHLIAEAARKYHLDPLMIRAVVQTESAFDAMAVSPVGAIGLMQLMPDVAAELGADDPTDPRQTIMAGSRYLRQLLNAHRGDLRLALASYNAGPGNVAKYRAIPPFKETRNYVKRVTGLLAEARANDH